MMTSSQSLAVSLTALMIFSLMVLAVFQSSALVTLAYDMEPGAITENLIGACEIWHSWMERIGAASMTELVRDIITNWHEATLSGEEF